MHSSDWENTGRTDGKQAGNINLRQKAGSFYPGISTCTRACSAKPVPKISEAQQDNK